MATAIKERTIPAMDTLVKYDNPVLITTHPEKVRRILSYHFYSFITMFLQKL